MKRSVPIPPYSVDRLKQMLRSVDHVRGEQDRPYRPGWGVNSILAVHHEFLEHCGWFAFEEEIPKHAASYVEINHGYSLTRTKVRRPEEYNVTSGRLAIDFKPENMPPHLMQREAAAQHGGRVIAWAKARAARRRKMLGLEKKEEEDS